MRAISARVIASRLALENAPAEMRVSTSSIQAMALMDFLQNNKFTMTAEDASSLMESISTVSWAEGDGGRVAETMNAAISPQSTAFGRRKQQDFMSFVSYFTESDWATLSSDDVSSTAKREIIAGVIVKLGGVNLIEFSIKLANYIWLIVALGYQKARSIDHVEKSQGKQAMADALKRIARNMYTGKEMFGNYLLTLPADPMVLATQYPALFARRFCDSNPVACKVDQSSLDDIEASYNCRGGGTSRGRLVTTAIVPAQSHDTRSGSDNTVIVQSVMQGLQMLCENQTLSLIHI